jgi:hypothetical protein
VLDGTQLIAKTDTALATEFMLTIQLLEVDQGRGSLVLEQIPGEDLGIMLDAEMREMESSVVDTSRQSLGRLDVSPTSLFRSWYFLGQLFVVETFRD